MFISIGLCGAVGLSQFIIVELSSTSPYCISVAEDEDEKRFIDEVFEGEDNAHGGQPEW